MTKVLYESPSWSEAAGWIGPSKQLTIISGLWPFPYYYFFSVLQCFSNEYLIVLVHSAWRKSCLVKTFVTFVAIICANITSVL